MADFEYTSPEHKKEIQGIADRSMTSSEDLQRQYLSGVRQAGEGILNRPTQLNLGGTGNEAMSAAIERRTRGDFEQAMNKLKLQAGVDSVNDRFNRLNSAAGLVADENAFNHQVRMARKIMKENRKRARAGVLGNILGIAGAVVGGYVSGGNPAGVGAGYAIGQGVGNVVGGGGM